MTATEAQIVYAATHRCPCGAGLAYPADADPMSGAWDCSALLTDTARDGDGPHTARLPFVYYEIKSEQQPSAHGQTTRPKDGAS